jgi:hypothetical protein
MLLLTAIGVVLALPSSAELSLRVLPYSSTPQDPAPNEVMDQQNEVYPGYQAPKGPSFNPMEPQRPHHHAEPGLNLVPDPAQRNFPPGLHHPPAFGPLPQMNHRKVEAVDPVAVGQGDGFKVHHLKKVFSPRKPYGEVGQQPRGLLQGPVETEGRGGATRGSRLSGWSWRPGNPKIRVRVTWPGPGPAAGGSRPKAVSCRWPGSGTRPGWPFDAFALGGA